jgi:hypothetical protein
MMLQPQESYFQLDPGLDGSNVAMSPPEIPSWPAQPAQDLANYMSDDNRQLFNHYFARIPGQVYPYEDILSYNPAKGSDFYHRVTQDLAAMHCVLMYGSISEAVLNSEPDSKGFVYHIARICAILNKKLDQNKAVDPSTIQCIADLASMGVSCRRGR